MYSNKIPSFSDLCSFTPEQLREKFPHLFSNSPASTLEEPTQVEENEIADQPVIQSSQPDWDHIYNLYREIHLGRYGY
jgi:hypothetical protein